MSLILRSKHPVIDSQYTQEEYDSSDINDDYDE